MLGNLLYSLYFQNTRPPIGTLNGLLLIRQGQSNQAIKVIGKDILYSANALYVKDKYIPFQNHQMTLYKKESFEENIVPILQQGTKVNTWQLWLNRLKYFEFAAICELLIGIITISFFLLRLIDLISS